MKTHNYQATVCFLATFLMGLFVIILNSNYVEAATTVPSTSEVYSHAPNGMDLSDYFEFPTDHVYYYNNKQSSIPDTASIISKSSSNPTDIIQMTNGTNQIASIWGRPTDSVKGDYNYFDVTKNQTFSMWMYFGDSDAKSGEGMAFVVQNDNRGADAISTYTDPKPLFGADPITKPAGLESLGVWAGGGSTKIINTTDFALGAIQNSLAIEFDSQLNTSIPTYAPILNSSGSKTDDYFDALPDSSGVQQVIGPHIAWNYPGIKDTYQYFNANSPYYSYFGMNHNNPIRNQYLASQAGYTTADNAWKHVTIMYTAPPSGSTIGQLRYIFDDKKYDGTVRPYKDWDQRGDGDTSISSDHKIINIDLKNLNLNGATKVRWGITGTTGSYSNTQAVIFESIPAIADVTTSTSLYDNTQERDIPDADRHPDDDHNVNNGDSLRFDYDLTYNSGLNGTGQITTTMDLPKHVDFTADADGNVGEIEYKNKTVKIPASSINSDGTIDLTLNSLNDDMNSIKIHLNGTANIGDNSTAKSTTVDPAHTSYESDYYTGDVMSPGFNINPVTDTLKIESTSDLKQTIKTGKQTTMSGKISYEKGSTFGADSVTVHTIIDGVKSSTTLGVDATSKSATYGLIGDASELGDGDHTIEVYVSDASHRFSNHIIYNITVEDKKLVISSDMDDYDNTFVKDVDTVELTGTLKYDDGSPFTLKGNTLKWTVDGDQSVSQPLIDSDNPDNMVESTDFSKVFPSLDVGKHVITLQATDGYKLSNTLTFNVTVTEESLTLYSEEGYAFKTVNRSDMSRVIPRAGKWNLSVDSLNASWKLSAKSTALINTTTGLPITGQMIYRTDNNEQSLETNSVEIGSGSGGTVNSDPVDITKNWSDDEGILLRVQPDTSQGTYQGVITWTLTNTMPNE
ncbi:L-type lectin family protein [Companilactobacillus hulinensis]|uniref:lectin-like domain-containing protein n=1 Tax=Companilactobacillus hulinensis TaxID=2486007 RepID=UPI000F78DC5E|nr:hypothetical protein [Companilactobacillus hulinensis]